MADVELAKALKDLPNRVQTASKKEWREILLPALSNPGVNDKIVNGICKVVLFILHRYKDSASQSYVKNLIVELIKQQPDATIKHMTTVISEQATWHKNVVAT